MKGLRKNPLYRPEKGGMWLASGKTATLFGLMFTAAVLLPMALGVCGCTMFTAGALGLVLLAALSGGNSVYGALTVEREKKTLDSLRLTQLTAAQVIWGKLAGEAVFLGRLAAATGPAVVLAGALGGVGLVGSLAAVAVALLAGALASVGGIYLSSLCRTTSQAVLAGWIGKAVWLLGTPVLDAVTGAVLVQKTAPPLFCAFNPLAVLEMLVLPEAASGLRAWLPVLFFLAVIPAIFLLGRAAARRYAGEQDRGARFFERQVHPAYRKGWGPQWLQSLLPISPANASFVRELAFQVRSGAGSWPGYLVFAVLFLAPFLYARTWAVQDADPRTYVPVHQRAQVQVVPRPAALQTGAAESPPLLRRTWLTAGRTLDQTLLVLEGHSPHFCLRLNLYRLAGVPLPRDRVRKVSLLPPSGVASDSGYLLEMKPQPLDETTARRLGLAAPPAAGSARRSPADRASAERSALSMGISGTLVLFLLYLAIRCSGFLAGALTGERERRSWEDLALTRLSPSQLLSGKLWGTLLLPLVQMTAVFPVLLFFVFTGNLRPVEVAGLWLFAVALAVTAGLLGLWASALSASTHDAHGRVMGLIFVAFFLLPAMPMPVMAAGALGAAIASMLRRRTAAPGWFGAVLALMASPHAASPLTAVVSFLPSLARTGGPLLAALPVAPATGLEALIHFFGAILLLVSLAQVLWKSTLDRLDEPRQSGALRGETAAYASATGRRQAP